MVPLHTQPNPQDRVSIGKAIFFKENWSFFAWMRGKRETRARVSRYAERLRLHVRVKQGSVMALSFEAVIFDCDGVLVDSEALGLDASADYLRGHGFAWSPQDLVRMFTGFRDDVFAAKLTEEYRALHGCDPDAEFFAGLIETRRARRHLLKTVPGARDILETLELPKAVASSSRTEFLHGKMKRVGIFDLVAPHVYSADLVAHGKPAPDVFLYTAEQLDIDPQRCLVIEDSENGVRAGIAAGMTVWGFLGGGHIFDGHGERLLSVGAAETVDDFAALMRALSPA